MLVRNFLSALLAIITSGILSGDSAIAQNFNDRQLAENLSIYAKANPSTILFVHTDKTVYTNNETIWFSAYLLKSEAASQREHIILSVTLATDHSKQVLLHRKFDMQDGLSFGSLALPDSIPPGDYHLIASTNILDRNNDPVALFKQPLTLKSITQNSFTSSIRLLDSVVTNGRVRAEVTVSAIESKSKEKPLVDYSISGGLSRSVTLRENTAIITIPASSLNTAQPVVLATVNFNKEKQYLSLKLPAISSQEIKARFFPEGGSMVDGLESTIAWEAKNRDNLPVGIRGILYKDQLPVDTIFTNSYGIGTFRLRPDIKSAYFVKVSSNPHLKKDTVYSLPPTLPEGVVLRAADAAVNDTLKLWLYSREAKKTRVLIHNYKELFASFELIAQPAGSKVSVVMPIIRKGLATVTVLDSLERPLAERIFFAHYNEQIFADISTDKQIYARKDSVHVRTKFTDKNGLPVPGIISIAAVQDNRLEGSKQQNIENYLYLKHDIGDLPADPQGKQFRNREYLQDILLVKGWRRYTWQDAITASPKDSLFHTHSALIRGNITRNGKALVKPGTVSILKSAIDVITTEPDGAFLLQPEHLLTAEGKKVLLFVTEKNPENYALKVDDPYMAMAGKLAKQPHELIPGFAIGIQNSNDQKLAGMERMIGLKEVVVSASKTDNMMYGTLGKIYDCNAYVCRYDVLNCRNHPYEGDNRPPTVGMSYNGRVYMGCVPEKKEDRFIADPIYENKEFYGVSADAAGLLEPQFLSTIFWRAGTIVNNSGETKFSFPTGDITGKFRIVIQGLSAEDVIFSEGGFVVK